VDFGLFSETGVPICMFWLGTINPARLEAAGAKNEAMPALHSSKYYPDPRPSIETGVRTMTAAITKLLSARR
jgi:hippurate hydrolase